MEQTPMEILLEELKSRRLDLTNHPHVKPFVLTAKLKEIDRMISCLEPKIDIDKAHRDKFKHTKEDVVNAYDTSQIHCVAGGNMILKAMGKPEMFEFSTNEAEQYYNETFKP